MGENVNRVCFFGLFLVFLAGCATDQSQYEPQGTKHVLPHPKTQEKRHVDRSVIRALPVPMYPSDEVEKVEPVDLPAINLPPDPEDVIERERAAAKEAADSERLEGEKVSPFDEQI